MNTQPHSSLLVLVLSFVLALSPGAELSAQTTFGETTDVVEVEVPVYVVENGQPVRGLTAEDFVVYDRRKRQELSGFSVVDLGAVSADGPALLEAETLPIAARRHFLFVFDLSFARPAAVLRARDAAKELVREDLHPTDLVAVASYHLSKGPRVILGFTPDRQRAEIAIDALGTPEMVNPASDPLDFMLRTLGEMGGRAQLFGVQDNYEQFRLDNRRRLLVADQNDAAAYSRGFADLARLLRGIRGRKHLVLLSEGFNAQSIMGTGDKLKTYEFNQAAIDGEYWRVDSEERFGATDVISVLENMVSEFRISDCIVQSVDIGGLDAPDTVDEDELLPGQITGSGRENSLFFMAHETGGELYRNFNDLGKAMNHMLDRTSVTYLLSFQPESLETDGEYHRLKVELKDRRRAQVLHRPGYHAPLPYSEMSLEERRLQAAEKIVSGVEGGAIHSSLVAAPFPVPGGQAYVPMLLDIDGPTLLAEHEGRKLGLELYAYVFTVDGEAADFLAQTMELDVEQLGETLRQRGAKFYGHFDLDPGDYQVRVLLRETKTGRSSVRKQRLRVPDFAGGEPALTQPLIIEPPGEWVILRENPRPGKDRDVPFPFLRDGRPYLPSARPAVARRGETDVQLVAYHMGEGPFAFEGEVVDQNGRALDGVHLELLVAEPGSAPGMVRLAARLETKGLEPGEHRLKVSLEGEEQAEAEIPIVVLR